MSGYDEYDQRNPDSEQLPPIEIPFDSLSPEALNGVLESFILREGTDYGSAEVAFETKLRQVRQQLDKGQIKIVFDPNTESVTVLTDRDWRRLTSSK